MTSAVGGTVVCEGNVEFVGPGDAHLVQFLVFYTRCRNGGTGCTGLVSSDRHQNSVA
jgi:hypothetical protein